MTTMLSIDWDFFLYNGLACKNPGSDWMLFDWGHSESWHSALQELIWAQRSVAFQVRGTRIEDQAGVRPSLGCTLPDDFISVIRQRFPRINDEPVTIADSHVEAMYVVHNHDLSESTVWHFDAHHDLGYDSIQVQREAASDRCDCASWLFHSLNCRMVKDVVIVYPDWRGMREWESSFGSLTHLHPFASRIRVMTWSDFLANASLGSQDDVAGFLCRSSAWTIPHLDQEFLRLASSLSDEGFDCLDCLQEKGHDACVPRPAPDHEEVVKLVQHFHEARDLCAKLNEEKP